MLIVFFHFNMLLWWCLMFVWMTLCRFFIIVWTLLWKIMKIFDWSCDSFLLWLLDVSVLQLNKTHINTSKGQYIISDNEIRFIAVKLITVKMLLLPYFLQENHSCKFFPVNLTDFFYSVQQWGKWLIFHSSGLN